MSQKYSVLPTSAFFTHSIIPTYCTTNVKQPGTISTGRSRLCNLYAGEPTFSCIIPEWSMDNLRTKSNHQLAVRQRGSMHYTQHFCTSSLRSQQHNSTYASPTLGQVLHYQLKNNNSIHDLSYV